MNKVVASVSTLVRLCNVCLFVASYHFVWGAGLSGSKTRAWVSVTVIIHCDNFAKFSKVLLPKEL